MLKEFKSLNHMLNKLTLCNVFTYRNKHNINDKLTTFDFVILYVTFLLLKCIVHIFFHKKLKPKKLHK